MSVAQIRRFNFSSTAHHAARVFLQALRSWGQLICQRLISMADLKWAMRACTSAAPLGSRVPPKTCDSSNRTRRMSGPTRACPRILSTSLTKSSIRGASGKGNSLSGEERFESCCAVAVRRVWAVRSCRCFAFGVVARTPCVSPRLEPCPAPRRLHRSLVLRCVTAGKRSLHW